MPPPVLRELESDDPRWDDFVLRHPEGTFFHLLGWRRVIASAYRRSAHYLFVEREDRIEGVLPLFLSGGPPFGRALVSVPVGVSGGVLAEGMEVAQLLRQGARALAERLAVGHVEYRSERAVFDDLPTRANLYVTFRQPLFGDREKQLAAIPRKTRAVLRQAERSGLRASVNRDDLEPFLDLYALSLRNLGTPMFPRSLFQGSLETFPRACDFVSVRHRGRVVGIAMNYYFRDTMLPFFAGVLPEARDLGANNYLYWFMLEGAFDRGFKVFDFGRSKVGTGPYRFKKHFGMQESPLAYQYDLVKDEAMPNLNPTNPRYARAIALWKKLPVAATKVVGPLLSRRLP